MVKVRHFSDNLKYIEYIDILPEELNKIIKEYGRNPDECRLKWRDHDFLVVNNDATTCTARVSGKTRKVVRFNVKTIESFLGLNRGGA